MTTDSQENVSDRDLTANPCEGDGRPPEEGPLRLGKTMVGAPVWYVTGAAEVRSVLSDPRFVVTNTAREPGEKDPKIQLVGQLGVSEELAAYIVDLLPDRDGAAHTRLRKLVAPPFTARRVAKLRSRVEEITEALLDEIEAAGPGPVDLINAFAYPLPITVICELVGVPEADRPAWRDWGDALLSLDAKRFAPALQAMVDQVEDLVVRRRDEPGDDLITTLLRAHSEDEDALSEHDLVKMIITLVLTGHETTAHLLSNSVAALLTHPDQLELLRKEPERWPTAVHELMRRWTPVRVTAVRYATETVEIGGVEIKAGEAVLPVLVDANQDPREYGCPERFDITRREDKRSEGHVGFGHGAHYCLGAPLARQEAEVALQALFRRFPDLAIAGEPQWSSGGLMVRMTQLLVSLRP
ncbi:cytochrome P450 [Streptomyces sp. NPDC052101]|uniref:cytochrome P450 family protein n=1 Tax=Streptomyces sp. NPDC052101 TaxID=3155763 RepID=UPI00343ADE15